MSRMIAYIINFQENYQTAEIFFCSYHVTPRNKTVSNYCVNYNHRQKQLERLCNLPVVHFNPEKREFSLLVNIPRPPYSMLGYNRTITRTNINVFIEIAVLASPVNHSVNLRTVNNMGFHITPSHYSTRKCEIYAQ